MTDFSGAGVSSSMMKSIRSWFTTPEVRASGSQDYTSALLAQSQLDGNSSWRLRQYQVQCGVSGGPRL